MNKDKLESIKKLNRELEDILNNYPMIIGLASITGLLVKCYQENTEINEEEFLSNMKHAWETVEGHKQ